MYSETFLFWTEDGEIIRLNLADGVKVTLVTNTGTVNVIKLDYIKKRVYWLESSSYIRHIKSSDYAGKGKKTITSGPFHEYLLGLFGDSLYFLNTSEYRIHEMNVSSGNISRKILVDNARYYDLTVVYKYFQLTGECSMSCGPFGYCNKYKDSCQCGVGFEMKENTCKDIDECLSLPCGPNATKKCINLQGSYKCSACDEGFSLYQNPLNEERCIAYSDLQIQLVKSKNNNTGTIQIYHPSFGWGTVCGWWRWTKAEGAVVCRQLGFTGVNVPRKNAHYGQGSGPILLDYVRCTGDESYIWDCKHPGWNNVPGYCHHRYDAGVDCY